MPLLADHPPSLRAQILTARDHYRSCFGRDPRGIWLPECAYVEGVEVFLQEANIRWFILDTHGLLHARPRPRYGTFAPIFTPNGIAAFGRDFDSSRQVWSQHEGYPGDARYRDFYRDIGFDLDFDYVKPHLPSPENRGFTGIKYYRITGGAGEQADLPARPRPCRRRANTPGIFSMSASNRPRASPDFWTARRWPSRRTTRNCSAIGGMKGRSFWIISRAKLFYDQKILALITPSEYLHRHPTNQIAAPGASSWGEEGYWRAWLNETNEWIYPHLQIAQERMTGLAQKFPHGDRPEGAGVAAGRARIAAGAGQRLAVHFARRAPVPITRAAG